MDINSIRQQYPQYSDMSDGELAFKMWNSSYSDMPMGMFADKIKLPQNSFGQMVEFGKSTGYQPTEETTVEGYTPAGGVPRAALQGMTLGFGDELVGGISAGIEKARGSERPFGEIYSDITEQERQRIGQFREGAPVTAAATEIAGAIAPAVVAGAPAALSRLPATARAAISGGTQGAIYGAGSAEGGAQERARGAVEVGIPSALFGAAAQQAFNIVGRGAQAAKRAFQNSATRPSLETMRTAKNEAYKLVDDSGIKFPQQVVQRLGVRARQIAEDANYVPDVDRQTFAAIKMIENQAGKEPTIGQLDKLRQGLWARYNSSNGGEPAILDMIDEIDNVISELPATNELMTLAREANSRFKKSELLDLAMDRAQLQTASTGSGGNILNKYKQAVTSIITNPKKSKWFNDVELDQMRQFVEGSLGQNAMRQIGKLSPTGNGLMLALNIGAIATNPAMAAGTIVGAGAKGMADRSAQKGLQEILDTVANGVIPEKFRAAYMPVAPSITPAVEVQRRGNQ